MPRNDELSTEAAACYHGTPLAFFCFQCESLREEAELQAIRMEPMSDLDAWEDEQVFQDREYDESRDMESLDNDNLCCDSE